MKQWLAKKIFKKEIENIHKYLRKKIDEQNEEIMNLKLRIYELIK